MKNLHNNNLKNDWPMVGTLPKNAYLCSKTLKEMSEESILTGIDDEETALKPYTREELLEMAETGRKQIAEGNHFTTEEVLQHCGYNIDSKVL